ncbi:DUF5665 domain-containing protein [Jannaschia donghaensis]|uniref:Uncharacterized protein n=1 Tax=Jannaschia donghaensis TaxID=420998 RepID=A0A0M6YHS6_9RHOB|nr:DUF5665 domain-containing protein [Jannaschia donghaensis]CTQ49073.1 hypothetical protein JDO7802_01083 [Jannaschia donghaensis]
MDQDHLIEELTMLRREMQQLNNHRFIKIHNSLPRLVAFQLYRGIAFGLGGVLGATVFLSVTVWTLSQIDFIPIIGDWATEIIEIMQPNMNIDVEVNETPETPGE